MRLFLYLGFRVLKLIYSKTAAFVTTFEPACRKDLFITLYLCNSLFSICIKRIGVHIIFVYVRLFTLGENDT